MKDNNETPAVLLAGGRPIDGVAVARFMSRTLEKTSKPKVAYIGAANGDRATFFEMIRGLLRIAGARTVDFVRLACENADIEKAKMVLASADVIFISGGEVEDGMNWLKKHALTDFLKDLYAEGKQFAGISAGAIMLGARWVKWRVPEDDETAELFDCLGIIPAVFDTHAENEDWIELKTALKLMGDGARGYGLPAGCVISADSRAAFVCHEKSILNYINDGGMIRLINNDSFITGSG